MTNKMISLDDLTDMMRRGTEAMLEASLADMERTRYFYLGYTRLEESVWLRFNRCCHQNRKIAIKERPMVIRVGKPRVSFRRNHSATHALTPHVPARHSPDCPDRSRSDRVAG